MGLATHQGPWLLGTVKNNTAAVSTANAQLGLNRNTGATSVGQTATVTGSDAANTAAFVVPAGSIITNIAFYTGGIVGATALTVSVNATQIASFTLASATAFAGPASSYTPAAAATLANVGTSDVVIKYSLTGASGSNTGILLVEYIVRNSDGTAVPASG